MRREILNLKDMNKIIPLGQKIMVYVNEGNFKGTYSSYIYDIDDNGIYILMPTNENGLKAVIREHEAIDVSFVTKNNGRIGFNSEIKNIIKKEDKVIYLLKRPEKIEKMELRDNFRVEVLLDVEFYYIQKGRIQKHKGTIIDISAGGVKLSCDLDLEIRDRLFLKFKLGSYLLDQIETEVARKVITGEKDVKHYGLKFIDLDKDKEERIIKFCINKQLEFARKMRGV